LITQQTRILKCCESSDVSIDRGMSIMMNNNSKMCDYHFQYVKYEISMIDWISVYKNDWP